MNFGKAKKINCLLRTQEASKRQLEVKKEEQEVDYAKQRFRSTMQRLDSISALLDTTQIQSVNELILKLPRIPSEIYQLHEQNEDAIRATEENMKSLEIEIDNQISEILELDIEAKRANEQLGTIELPTAEDLNQMISKAKSEMDLAEKSGTSDRDAQIRYFRFKVLEAERGRLQERRGRLQERRGRLEAERGMLLRHWFTSMKDAMAKVNFQLTTLVGLNQDDPLPSQTLSTTAQAEERQTKRELAELQKEDLLPHPQHDWAHEIKRLIVDKSNDNELFHAQSLFCQDASSKKLHDNFQKLFAQCSVTNSCKGETALPDGFAQAFFKSLRSLDDASQKDEAKLYVPGPRAAEVPFTQPFLEELLREIGRVAEGKDQEECLDEKSRRASPQKSFGCKNRPVPQFGLRRRRIADKSLVPAYSRFKFLCPDHSVEIRIEEKRGERSNTNPEDMFTEAVGQAVAHLAKFVSVGFNFAAHGVDTVATGLVLCPAYVAVVRVELVGTGTTDVKLKVHLRRPYPLLSRSNFEKWCEQSLFENKWKNFEFASTDSISGWCVIWNVMRSSRNELFGPRMAVCTEEGDVRQAIAYGGFASIHHSIKENMDCVTKVSRFGTKAHIENEVAMLKVLSGSNCKNIPELVEPRPSSSQAFATLNLLLGTTTVRIPSLTIRPLGIPIMNFVRSRKQEDLTQVGQHIGDALRFIHKREIVHLDVTPRNIIWDNETSAFILIDFGLAAKLGARREGICGTLAFMPKEILTKYPSASWKTEKKYDWISLGLTMAALKHFVMNSTQSLPWTVPSSPKMNVDSFDKERTEWALQILSAPHSDWVNGSCTD